MLVLALKRGSAKPPGAIDDVDLGGGREVDALSFGVALLYASAMLGTGGSGGAAVIEDGRARLSASTLACVRRRTILSLT